VHAKGWGAYGTLTISGDLSRYTKAKLLQPGASTPLVLRFSTVAGELGASNATIRRDYSRASMPPRSAVSIITPAMRRHRLPTTLRTCGLAIPEGGN
jgi:hypothetical protein